MSDEAWKALSIIVPSFAVFLGRWLSNKEHRKTERKVNDIYIIVNGGHQKKLEEAKEEGRQEILNQKSQ